jgi:hypothetical protein
MYWTSLFTVAGNGTIPEIAINFYLQSRLSTSPSTNQDNNFLCVTHVLWPTTINNNSCCKRHPGQFLVWRRGNPRFSEKVRNAFHAAQDMCSSHMVKGSCQLLPQEVRHLRNNLISTENHEDLQLLLGGREEQDHQLVLSSSGKN